MYRSPTLTWVTKIDLRKTDPELYRHVWRSWRHAAANDTLIGISTDGDSLGILSLRPSVADGSRFRLLTLGSHGIVVYAHVDVSQDLLVVVDNREEITLRSFSAGTTHPQCTSMQPMRMPPLQEREFTILRSISVSGQWLLACNEVGGPGVRSTNRSKLYHWPSGREQMVTLKVFPISYHPLTTDPV